MLRTQPQRVLYDEVVVELLIRFFKEWSKKTIVWCMGGAPLKVLKVPDVWPDR